MKAFEKLFLLLRRPGVEPVRLEVTVRVTMVVAPTLFGGVYATV